MIRAEVVHNLHNYYPAAKAFERVVLILEELGLSLHQVIIILTPVADGTHISINTKIDEAIDPETAAENMKCLEASDQYVRDNPHLHSDL